LDTYDTITTGADVKRAFHMLPLSEEECERIVKIPGVPRLTWRMLHLEADAEEVATKTAATLEAFNAAVEGSIARV
jgi:hypothetical protein